MSNIKERVKAVVAERLGVRIAEVTDAASFVDDLGADELDTIELVVALEQAFGCEIPDDAAEALATSDEVTSYLAARIRDLPPNANTPQTGTVTSFDPVNGYGFIQPDDGSSRTYVHFSAVERAGLHTLREGQHVRYDLVARDGKAAAENLVVDERPA